VLPNGELRWISAHGETLGDAAGMPVRMIGTNLDITRRKEQENNIQFLLREVSHRSKNLLAIIQAMATQTGRSSRNYDEFQSRFSQRLQGMAASHDLLVSQNWEGADLAALVRAQLRPFAEESSGRIELTGPSLVLTPVAAQSIGMALHELATNATKYGALSGLQGKVVVSWQVLPESSGYKFQMTWQERGGPAVEPPARNGFGHLVFERMVKQALNASIALGYPQEGFAWTIETTLASVTDPPA
jgi:two-component sensor histidine kinase